MPNCLHFKLSKIDVNNYLLQEQFSITQDKELIQYRKIIK
jgi:hypothetical protein